MNENLRFFETDSYRIILNVEEDLFSKHIMKRISKKFVEKNQELIKRSHTGDVTAFESLTQKIEEITHHKGIKLVQEIRKLRTSSNLSRYSQFIAQMINDSEESNNT